VIKEAIIQIVNKQDLTYDEAYAVMSEIMEGQTTPTQNAAFLAALSTKNTTPGTVDEIAGGAAAMREHSLRVPHDMDTLDIAGTGGDSANSFNISTTAAFVLAAGGVKVAKHGSVANSSESGTADCLQAMGANILQEPEQCVRMLKEVGMCFLFSQKYHAAIKYIGPVRRELGFRTVFNVLGPLINPAYPAYQLLGVYDESLVEPLARVLQRIGVRKGMTVYGQDGFDEISLSAATTVCDFSGGDCRTYEITPEQFGLTRCRKEDVRGGTPEENARLTREILSGAAGPKRDIVLLNAGAGFYAANAAPSIAEGIELARRQIDSGAALAVADAFVEKSFL
jgi:anthranilate phosphoribosyltransferase